MARDYNDRQDRVRSDRLWTGEDARNRERFEADAARSASREGRVRRHPLDPAHGESGPADEVRGGDDPGTDVQDDVGPASRGPAAASTTAAGEVTPRQIEPNRVDVERRAGDDRRVADVPVAEDRRVADRRAARERDAAEARERRSYAVSRVMMGVDYLFYLLYGLLGVRFVLALLGASEQAGFVQFINGITQPFYGPFAGIVARPAINGGVLDFPVLIALLAYALLHMAVRGLLRLMISPRA